MMKQYFFKSHMIKMVTFVQCNIFEWIWYSESILIVYLFTSGKKMSQQQCMPVFIQMKLDPVWIQYLQIKLTKFVNFYWMLCLIKKNVTSYLLFHAMLKGNIHISLKHSFLSIETFSRHKIFCQNVMLKNKFYKKKKKKSPGY